MSSDPAESPPGAPAGRLDHGVDRLERRDAWVLAAYFLVVGVLLATPIPSQGLVGHTWSWPRSATVLAMVVGTAALLWRRRTPLMTLVLTGSAAVAELAFGGNVVAYVLLFDALWSPVVHGSLRLARATTVCGFLLAVAVVGAVVSPHPGSAPVGFSLVLGLLIVSVAIVSPLIWGWEVRFHVAARFTAERLVETQRELSAERAARAVDLERGRIAQDLHDLVAGHLSAVTLHTTLATTLADEQARRRSLTTANDSAQAALRDLRSVILMLSDRDADHLPTPTLGWTTLADRLSAGQPAQTHVDRSVDDPARVDPLVRAAILRIASEAVTNATRHGRSPRSLQVTVGDEAVTLTCRNGLAPTTRADAHPGTGLGLETMRHQAAAVGGSLDAGPDDGTGWLVQARLPRSVTDDTRHDDTRWRSHDLR